MSAPAVAAAAVGSSANSHFLMEDAKALIADLLVTALPGAFPAEFPSAAAAEELRPELLARMTKSTVKGAGDLCLPCFVFAKKIKGPPAKTATALADALAAHLKANPNEDIVAVAAAGPYVNFFVSTAFMARVIPKVLDGSYLTPLSQEGKAKVMIEYSQPNTHKAFHVGHCRNVALGDCLVRLHEAIGHPVVAVNYFGDEGAHVAKCLWFLTEYLKQHPTFDLDKDVPPEARGEWLGGMYSQAVEALDLASLTDFPFPHVVPAKVLSIDAHPAADAPPNWHVVSLSVDAAGTTKTVVCGGKGYAIGDLVAYMPVGVPIKGGKLTVEPKDMKGVLSHGIIMASKELGIEEPEPAPAAVTAAAGSGAKVQKPKADKAEPKPKAEKAPKDAAAAAPAGGAAASSAPAKKENKGKCAGKDERESPNNKIHVFPAGLALGVPVTEQGRKANLAHVPADRPVLVEHESRKQAVRDMLRAMEGGDAGVLALWEKTKRWSLDEFRAIYAWLHARFDYDFFESECSEPSRKLVEEYRGKVFHDSNGALGADLSKFNLGFCMVLKSDGAGLYATKDLALAQRKFDEFKIDQSIYVVDAAQTLHFKQVFKTLELMGYEKAKNCVHIPYGQVVLPSGKMSSRTGTVIMFSQLRQMLAKDIYENFLAKYDPAATPAPAAAAAAEDEAAAADGAKKFVKSERNSSPWSAEALADAQHKIALATIKYGMLNHDTVKDIVFVLDEWAAKSGNTGPYMLYAYARIASIIREVRVPDGARVDYTLLSHESERALLTSMHELWEVVRKTAEARNPSTLCNYLFDLSKSFSSWYEIAECSVNNARVIDPLTGGVDEGRSADLKMTRIHFITAIAKIIQFGLRLLGIDTLERM